MSLPKISIITPVYNMLPFLQLCTKSVSDQGVIYEHIIIDGNSTDGTKNWLSQADKLKWVSSKDNGMYDALNKGLSMAEGEIIGHLNADEQYLSGTLSYVVNFFNDNPDIDYITGDYLMVDKEGELIAYRKSFPPFWPFFFSNYLYTLTCAFFYRKKVSERLKYNDRLKSIADVDFFYKIQKQGFKGYHIKRFMATFTYTGDNICMLPDTVIERKNYERTLLPKWFPLSKYFFKALFYSARIVYQTLWHKSPLEYGIYDSELSEERKGYCVKNPSWKLPKQIKYPVKPAPHFNTYKQF